MFRMRKTRTTEVGKALVLVATLAALPAAVSARTVQGVDWDAVPWEIFCPSVKPVELHTGAGSCAISHPASPKHARWDGFGMGVDEPKPNCSRLEQDYERLTSPKLIAGKRSGNTAVTWGYCMSAFAQAIELRAKQPERFSEPFEQWRERYFDGYIAKGRR
jgi:hypothetical protein